MVAGPAADVAANYAIAIPASELSLQLAHPQVFLPQQQALLFILSPSRENKMLPFGGERC